ncbi:MAG: DUF58 domain-containing protein [Acidimicrobiales bacterium]
MPTRSGWGLLMAGAALVVAGRVLGPLEFYVAGSVAIAAVTLAVLIRWTRPSSVTIVREVSPGRVPVGEATRIDLHISNRTGRRSPVLRVNDAISGTRGVRLSIAPIPSGATTRGAYRLPTTRRGVLDIGPMRVEDADGLGLARRTHRVPSFARLLVHPPVETLPIARVPAGDDRLLGDELRCSLGSSNEEFDGLREYVAGDDPRRIHWPSTARHDELLVRQYRPPRHGRLTVVIDTRPPGDDDAGLDRTTSVAASVAAAVLQGGDAVRIQTTDGRSTPVLLGSSHLEDVLEFVAILQGGAAHIDPAVPSSDGTVVVVTSDPGVVHDRTRAALALRLRATLVISCDILRWSPDRPGESGTTGDWIHLTGPGQLGALWRLPSAARVPA